MPDPAAPSFIAGAMLGRLARWLRALGYDTVYAGTESDREIAARARAEGRDPLTRDRRLSHEQAIDVYLVGSESPLEQLREVTTHFALVVPAELFTRCLVCNAELRAAMSGGDRGGRTPGPSRPGRAREAVSRLWTGLLGWLTHSPYARGARGMADRPAMNRCPERAIGAHAAHGRGA